MINWLGRNKYNNACESINYCERKEFTISRHKPSQQCILSDSSTVATSVTEQTTDNVATALG